VIAIADLRAIAEARLDDANVLLANNRFDGAGYLCGYAVELALKAQICTTLNWQGFPETGKEFENLGSFKTHKLEVLLRLSGQEQRIKSERFSEWSAVETWDPEARYKAVGHADPAQVELMVVSAILLLGAL
jgi:HEPN domain-containing protein